MLLIGLAIGGAGWISGLVWLAYWGLGLGARWTAERLSAITWNVQEQKAWMQAYEDARRLGEDRARRAAYDVIGGGNPHTLGNSGRHLSTTR